MTLKTRCIPTVLATSALISIATNISAEESPFQAEVFHSASYQIADLDEEGCGGAMTEYRRAPPEEEKPTQSEPAPAKDAEPEKTEKRGIVESIKLFWANLFRQADK